MSVTAAMGFRAAGVAAGIKPAGELDMALVVGPPGTVGSAMFTTNAAAAPPVQLSRTHMESGPSLRGVVLNSGCANAGTGPAGYAVARETAAGVALGLGCDDTEVVVCSTGPIGPQLDATVLRRGVGRLFAQLADSEEAGAAAAAGILTTDTLIKEATAFGGGFVVGGMAKGAGMVRPDMATMLAVVTTDAAVTTEDAAVALRDAVDESFHSLNIDGCASTNDTVVLMASAGSGTGASAAALGDPLREVCRSLAEQMAADAEGASRVVRLRIRGAVDAAQARRLGRRIADSALVRASFFGGDPNWGRILGALGAAEVPLDSSQVSVAYGGVPVARGGVGVGFDQDAVVAALAGDFRVEVSVGEGPGAAEILTTDLTPDYVIFNGEPS